LRSVDGAEVGDKGKCSGGVVGATGTIGTGLIGTTGTGGRNRGKGMPRCAQLGEANTAAIRTANRVGYVSFMLHRLIRESVRSPSSLSEKGPAFLRAGGDFSIGSQFGAVRFNRAN
jgi:hypothetical protein